MCKKIKVLFICKKRKSSGPGPYANLMSSGLLNSANFVNEMLLKNGIESKIVEVIDNNGIDKEVHEFKPTHVIIEALWVVPSKFEVLEKLHPTVKWIVRLHSEMPFIANEGIAMDWIYGYMKYENVDISVNSPRIEGELNGILPKNVICLPNYYPISKRTRTKMKDPGIIDIGLFGAVRPLKNHLMQAVAAIEFANREGLMLRLHINGTRVENKGDSVLKNLRDLFENNTQHQLVEHAWMPHDEFVELFNSMDICMQVSFSETYNIVTADAINNLVPVVVSPEVKFVLGIFKSSPVNSESIIKKLWLAYYLSDFGLEWINKGLLYWNSLKSEMIWVDYFKDKSHFCECKKDDCNHN